MTTPAPTSARGALLPPPILGHHRGMAKTRTAKDAQRVQFIAPLGSSELYAEIAELEGVPVDAWIRATLHKEAVRVLEAQGRDTAELPPPHLARPPRLQPRWIPDEDA